MPEKITFAVMRATGWLKNFIAGAGLAGPDRSRESLRRMGKLLRDGGRRFGRAHGTAGAGAAAQIKPVTESSRRRGREKYRRSPGPKML
jgi:hypothetical protein